MDRGRKPVILNVDDDPDILAMTESILEGAGYDVKTAQSGGQAIKMLGSIQPDLILLDATMPDMDGNAVCAAIRANRATADTAVIFFTGSDDPENREAARVAGATGYLVKPVPIPVLIQRVAEYIERTSRSKGPFR